LLSIYIVCSHAESFQVTDVFDAGLRLELLQNRTGTIFFWQAFVRTVASEHYCSDRSNPDLL